MTIISCVGTFSRLTPPTPPQPGIFDVDGTFYENNLTLFSDAAYPNNITPEGVFSSPDGLRIYAITSGGIIYQYDLTAAFDFSTAVYNDDNISVSSYTGTTGNNRDLFFDDSGTRLFVISDATERVTQFALTTPWDIMSLTYNGLQFNLTSPGEATHKAIVISSDGTKYFVLGNSTDSVFQYEMTTAWDITQSVYSNKSFYVGGSETTPEAIAITPDGRTLLVGGTTSDSIYEFLLDTPWDLTGVTLIGEQHVSSRLSVLRGLCYHPDYLIATSQTSNNVITFKLKSSGSSSKILNIIQEFAEEATVRMGSLRFNNTGSIMYILRGATIYEYSLSTPYDISTSTYTGNSYLGELQDDTLDQNIFFDPTGTRYYIIGYNSSLISQYSMTSPYDLNSRSFVALKNFFSGTGNLNIGSGGGQMGVHITPDGTKLFVALFNSTLGSHGIFRADFATPWDVSTLTTDISKTNYKFLHTTHGLSANIIPEFSFSPDARKLYLYDKGTKLIMQFGLSSPYSIGSCVLEKTYDVNYLDNSTFSYVSFAIDKGVLIFHGNSRRFTTQFNV